MTVHLRLSGAEQILKTESEEKAFFLLMQNKYLH